MLNTSEDTALALLVNRIGFTFNQLGIKKFVLVGWSFAVMEALSFYEQFSGDRVEALVFIDGDLSYEVPDQDAVREIHFLKRVAGVTQFVLTRRVWPN